MKKKLTTSDVENAKTVNGGWTKKQLTDWGVSWPPAKGWKKALLGSESFEARSSQKRGR
jgi:hypothetical protein